MLFPDIPPADVVATFDTETTGLHLGADRAFGLAVAFGDQDFYWDLREHPAAMDWWRALSHTPGRRLVAHNAVFDWLMLERVRPGSTPAETLDDTGVRAVLIDEHLSSYSLEALCSGGSHEKQQQPLLDAMANLFGGPATARAQMPRIAEAPAEWVGLYARADVRATAALWGRQEREIKRQGLERVCALERACIPVLARMQGAGIRVDVERAAAAQAALSVEINRVQRGLTSLIGGRPINVNSSHQVRELFRPVRRGDEWWSESGTPLPTTSTGAPSVGAAQLRILAAAGDARADYILRARSLVKTRDTFLGAHVLGREFAGRVYPSINQTRNEGGGTVTGRLSYVAPAMQQIPSRSKDVAARVKPVFLPDEGHHWLDADMASFEVRVFAHLVQDENILRRYREDPKTDFHAAVAELTGLPRSARHPGDPNAKTLNLSVIFCSGNGSIAERMGMPWEWEEFTTSGGERVRFRRAGPEAEEVIERYHQMLPGVRALGSRCSHEARTRGRVITEDGRHIRFPDARYSYKASGLLIQATAADFNKRALPRLDRALSEVGGRLLLNTHDSYSMSVPPDDPTIWGRLEEAIRDEFSGLRVPLLLERSGEGSNWWLALQGDA